MRISFFLLVFAAFILERVFQPLFSFPFFVFPAFFATYFLLSDNVSSDFFKVVLVALFLDFFSGGAPGMTVVSAIAVCLTIISVKNIVLIDRNSIFLVLIFSVFSVLEYFLVLSTLSGSHFRTNLVPVISIETMLWSAVVLMTGRIKTKQNIR